MQPLPTTAHYVEIFGYEFRWAGYLAIPVGRRVSDFFNVRLEDFIEIERVTLARWHEDPEHPLFSMARVAVSQSSMIVILFKEEQSQAGGGGGAGGAAPERVTKLPHPVRLVAPPFVLAGGFHVPPGANWFDAISLSRQRFIGLTQVTITFLEPILMPDIHTSFVLVNRQKISAIELPG